MEFPLIDGIAQWTPPTVAEYSDNLESLGYAVATFAGILLGLVLLRWFFKATVRKAKFAKHIGQLLEHSASSISVWTFVIIALYVALQRFELSDRQAFVAKVVTLSVVTVQLLSLLNEWVRYAFSDDGPLFLGKSHLYTIRSSLASVTIISIWCLGILLLLDNLGFNVAAIVAGLGVGGIAVGLALQSVFKDLIASFSIGFDKPFEVGDFIIVEDSPGTVDQVGLKTTRIRSLGGELLVYPNSKLVDSKIQNYKKMQERRVVFSFGVTYDTEQANLEIIPTIVRDCVERHENLRFDRAHFKQFGASSLDFEVVYYVLSPDYTTYMDAQQALNLAIRHNLIDRGVEFAFPTRTLEFNQNQFNDFVGTFQVNDKLAKQDNDAAVQH